MRKLLIVATLVLLCSCKTGYIDKELKGNLFDRFPNDFWDNDNEKYEEGIQYLAYIYKGLEFYPDSGDNWIVYIYPQKHQFYTLYNEYYRNNFNLKQRGKIFGNGHDCCINESIRTLKIGIWYQYDEQGKLIKQTDEDKKFGKFGYNELLQFLDKEKQINLRKGVDRDSSGDVNFEITYFYSEQSDKKLWHVFVRIGLMQTLITPPGQIGETVYQPGKGYYIDGNTGLVLKNFQAEKDYYKEIMN